MKKTSVVVLALAALVACSPAKANIELELLKLEYCGTTANLAKNVIESRQTGMTKSHLLGVSDLPDAQRMVRQAFTLEMPVSEEEAAVQRTQFELDALEKCLKEAGY